jgi:MOSC domain-containing protein YiiM
MVYLCAMDRHPHDHTAPCADCGFDPADWNTVDATRTLARRDELIAEWSDAVPAPASSSDEQARAVTAEIDAAPDLIGRVHTLWHGLVSIADRRRASGDAIPTQVGWVVQLNQSAGGVPKWPVDFVMVDRRGVVGDVQATRLHHGRPWQALCLWSIELIDALVADGHPIFAGATGENITVGGIDWASLRGGTIIDVGSIRCQLSAPAAPCTKNRRWFDDGDISRIDHDLHPGRSRWYASVLQPGSIAVGDPIIIEPPTAAPLPQQPGSNRRESPGREDGW